MTARAWPWNLCRALAPSISIKDGSNLGGATRPKFSVFAQSPLCEACFDDGSVTFDIPVVKHPGIRVRQAETFAAWAHLERESQGRALAPNSIKHKPLWTAVRPI